MKGREVIAKSFKELKRVMRRNRGRWELQDDPARRQCGFRREVSRRSMVGRVAIGIVPLKLSVDRGEMTVEERKWFSSAGGRLSFARRMSR